MDLQERRALIKTVANPDSNVDYVVDLRGHISFPGGGGRSSVEIRYVPDRWILQVETFDAYLKAVGGQEWPTLEELATTVLNDIANEVVPRWLQAIVSAPDDEHSSVDRHGVMLEDRQPNWNNPQLLARLKQH